MLASFRGVLCNKAAGLPEETQPVPASSAMKSQVRGGKSGKEVLLWPDNNHSFPILPHDAEGRGGDVEESGRKE